VFCNFRPEVLIAKSSQRFAEALLGRPLSTSLNLSAVHSLVDEVLIAKETWRLADLFGEFFCNVVPVNLI